MTQTYARDHIDEMRQVLARVDERAVDQLALLVANTRDNEGRLFVVGIGGSAANATHAAADLRELAEIEAYACADNLAELTARANDYGWDEIFVRWLRSCRAAQPDMLLLLSVGGGDADRGVSIPMIKAADYARERGMRFGAVVGREKGYVTQLADVVVLCPNVNPANITPHTESLQSVVCHVLCGHPALKRQQPVWERME